MVNDLDIVSDNNLGEVMMKKLMLSFFRDESGATMVEYAILVALISIAAIVVIFTLGQQIRETFNQVVQCITNPNGGGCPG
jgi:pilus assembly protein Flp/PilA